MKKQISNYIKIILLILFSGIIYTSCVEEFNVGNDFLVKPPAGDINVDTVFSNADYARRALWNTYGSLYYGLNWDWSARGNKMNMGLAEALTDTYESYLGWDNVNRVYYSGTYNASLENNQSKYHFTDEGSWSGIRKAYLFIKNVEAVPDMTIEEKNQLKSEAKMVIACHYADMFRHFGGLPLVTKAFAPTDDLALPRATAEDTYKFIVGLLDEAKASLPWNLPAEDISKWDGRFTKASAIGLKIRVLIFAASPLFNSNEAYYTERSYESIDKHQVWYGAYKPEIWDEALAACEEFFALNQANGDYYQLVTASGTDYRKAFRDAYFKRGTTEMLISTRIRYTIPTNYWDANYYFLQGTGYGCAVPTLNYVDMFPYSDGVPFDTTYWSKWKYKVSSPYQNPLVNRDPRLYETCFVNGDAFSDRKLELWVGGREKKDSTETSQYATGFGLYKFILDRKACLGAPAQWPYLRLAEIYLSYAEILNQTGRMEDAFKWVDDVRARVGMKGLKESNPGKVWTNASFLEEVLRERACEFGLEEIRWFDLIRYKREQDFRKRLSGLKIFRANPSDTDPIVFKFNKFNIKKRAWQDGPNGENNFSPKWYLSAFPVNEINKAYGLTQNPGW